MSVGVCWCTCMYMYVEVAGAVTIPGLRTGAGNPSSCPFTTEHALGKRNHVPTPFHMLVFFMFKTRAILEVRNVESISTKKPWTKLYLVLLFLLHAQPFCSPDFLSSDYSFRPHNTYKFCNRWLLPKSKLLCSCVPRLSCQPCLSSVEYDLVKSSALWNPPTLSYQYRDLPPNNSVTPLRAAISYLAIIACIKDFSACWRARCLVDLRCLISIKWVIKERKEGNEV